MSQFLEQGEVDALLRGLSDGEIKTEVLRPSLSDQADRGLADRESNHATRGGTGGHEA